MIEASAQTLTFVIHEASLSGAPLLGVMIAEALAKKICVDLVFRTGGRLLSGLDRSSFRSVTVIHDRPSDESARIQESVTAATEVLARQRPSYLYVNSLSASEWLLARPPSVKMAALHTHEASHEMESLVVGKLFTPSSVRRAEILVGATKQTIALLRNFKPDGFLAEIEFGIAIDPRRLHSLSREAPPEARNSRATPIPKGRPLVVMCGTASQRKGADIFANLAMELPEANFVWVGPWTADEGASAVDWVGTRYEALKIDPNAPANLYFTGPVFNPYPWIRAANVFFLSSREDPNPIVAIEALSLGRLVVAFRRSGQGGALCMTNGVAISGAPSERNVKSVIAALLERQIELHPPEIDWATFDIQEKSGRVIHAFGF